MFFYGLSYSVISESHLSIRCPNCTSVGFEHTVLQRYLHLLFIPILPLGKRAKLICATCKKKFPGDHFSPEMQFWMKESKRSAKTPWWTFTGTVLLILALPLIWSWNSGIKERSAALLKDPKVGDVYQVREDGLFVLYKLVEMDADSIYVVRTREGVKKLIHLGRLRKTSADGYDTLIHAVARKDLPEKRWSPSRKNRVK